MKKKLHSFCHTNTKNPGNNLWIFLSITGRPKLNGYFEALCIDWEYQLRNAWENQQYRKASGYSGIKAALRCSSATRLAHKPLNASLRSFVRGLQGRSQTLDALRNYWKYQIYNNKGLFHLSRHRRQYVTM